MRIDVHFHIHADSSLLERLSNALTHLQDIIMTTLQQIKDQISQVKQDIVSEKAEVQSKLSDLTAQIQVLTDQLNNGGVITQADLDNLSAQVADIDTGVKDISEPVPIA